MIKSTKRFIKFFYHPNQTQPWLFLRCLTGCRRCCALDISYLYYYDFFWSSVCWIGCGTWIWIHAWPPILHGPWPAMPMGWGGACLRTKALFGWPYLKFWIKEFYMNDILNKVYLQNFFIDECNLAQRF